MSFCSFTTQCADGAPVKLVEVGNVNTPLMCLAPSGHYQDCTTLWAGCGTRVLSLTVDYDISKSIDTRYTFYQLVSMQFIGLQEINVYFLHYTARIFFFLI